MKSKLHVVLTDQQCPHHDPRLHELVLRWLAENKPYGLHLGGDLADFTSLGKFDWKPRIDPEPTASAQKSIDVSGRLAAEYVQAAQPKAMTYTEGNHDARLALHLARNAPLIYGLRAYDDPIPRLSIPHLLGLDRLGFTWPDKPYPYGKTLITPSLATLHGEFVRKHAGMSALATLDKLRYSVIMGHTHRQGVVFLTQHRIDDTHSVHVGVEAGTLCDMTDGLGYTFAPNWQQGFATVREFADGTFSVGLASYVAGALRWEGQSYVMGARGVLVKR